MTCARHIPGLKIRFFPGPARRLRSLHAGLPFLCDQALLGAGTPWRRSFRKGPRGRRDSGPPTGMRWGLHELPSPTRFGGAWCSAGPNARRSAQHTRFDHSATSLYAGQHRSVRYAWLNAELV